MQQSESLFNGQIDSEKENIRHFIEKKFNF